MSSIFTYLLLLSMEDISNWTIMKLALRTINVQTP